MNKKLGLPPEEAETFLFRAIAVVSLKAGKLLCEQK